MSGLYFLQINTHKWSCDLIPTSETQSLCTEAEKNTQKQYDREFSKFYTLCVTVISISINKF